MRLAGSADILSAARAALRVVRVWLERASPARQAFSTSLERRTGCPRSQLNKPFLFLY
ncbi:MAG: hypothetical protein ACR2MG_19330 [Pyrinomonadaceae bacterium]